jgi:hypothetical protein
VADLSLTRDGVPVSLAAGPVLFMADDGRNWLLQNLPGLTSPAGQYVLTLTAAGSGVADLGGNPLAGDASDSWRNFASVAGRRVFYNNSFFDGNDAAANSADDAAVAPDKSALLPGQAAGFANVTGYSRGINGIMVDVAGLPVDATPTPADVAAKAGRGGDPSSWPDAPPPSAVAVRRGAGTDGSDRVTLTWPDGAIRNTWLRVTVLATARTGLAAPDVFSFGNLIGETGDAGGAGGGQMTVNARDLYATRRAAGSGPALLTSTTDHNRDGRVNALDAAWVRLNFFSSLTPPAPSAGAASAGGARDLLLSITRVVDFSLQNA